MPRKHPQGGSFGVNKVDGVSRSPVRNKPDRIPRRETLDVTDSVSDSIVQDLLRAIVVGEPEHVRLATAAKHKQRDIFLPGRRGADTPGMKRSGSRWPRIRMVPAGLRKRSGSWTLILWFIGALVVVAGLLMVSNKGIKVKRQVVKDGQAAVEHLMNARDAVERFDFNAASDDFSRAYERFGQARDDLGIFNTRLGSILSKLPGGEEIDSAQKLIQAGQLLAQAGGSLSELVSALAESGAILDPANDGRTSFATVLLPMQQALSGAAEYILSARALLDGVPVEHVPDEQRTELEELRVQLPELEQLVARGAAYVRFLESAIAGSGNRTYLLLFQNTSELRPTGGFPGSYGVAIFTDGRLLSFEADDVYNPDGQIEDLIVPPRALQHITPGWGLRDSTWFIDFPTSAQKAVELYEEGSGKRVDGVIAITPRIIQSLLEISGPVSMPEYDLVLSADDFLPQLQAQVEYGLDKRDNKPKKIIMDLAPIILRKLYQAPKGEWLKVLSVFSDGLKRRDIMMYLADEQLQEFVYQEGFDGRVYQGDEDYLTVNISNVKGGKADAVTETALHLESALTADGVEHELTIIRR